MMLLPCFVAVLTTLIKVNVVAGKDNVDPNASVVWGPGLNPDRIVLPVRYFFVELYNTKGKAVKRYNRELVDAYIGGPKQGQCRVWWQILHTNNGLFIVRYKLYHTCKNLKIDLRYNNYPIKGFPIHAKQDVLSDDCNCPAKIESWLDTMECKSEYPQIMSDLKFFKQIDFSKSRSDIISKFNKPNSVSLCHYIIKNNEVYRNCYGQYVGFKMFMDVILLSLGRKIKLPDVEMFVNLGDWPLVRVTDELIPIFSWCGSDSTRDIVMPTYDITESTLECMGRVMLDMLSVQGNTGPDWSNKTEKAFWRGRDSREERLKLIEISSENPSLFDTGLTNFFFFKDTKLEKHPHISFFEFFKYKYQITIDGTVAAYRLPYLLAGDSVVVKQDSPFYEHFYRELTPNLHYVPFKRNLTDLVDKIKWLKNHDAKAKKISLEAQRFARENLMPKDIFCYYAVLLNEWSKRLQAVDVIEGMEHVPQPTQESKCDCPLVVEHDEL